MQKPALLNYGMNLKITQNRFYASKSYQFEKTTRQIDICRDVALLRLYG